MAHHVLLIEDDDNIRTALSLLLSEEGYLPVEAASGEDGLDHFRGRPSDIVLVDLLLPGKDGFEVIRELRKMSDVPIIVVSARTDTHDIIAGLEAGADDYLTKPVMGKELTARIRVLLRRLAGGAAAPTVLRVGEVEIQAESGVVLVRDQPVAVTRTEFKVLWALASNPGWILTRTQLLDEVWGYDSPTNGQLVDAHIRRLRGKIEPNPSDPEHLVTVRGLGYKLVP